MQAVERYWATEYDWRKIEIAKSGSRRVRPALTSVRLLETAFRAQVRHEATGRQDPGGNS